MVSGRAPARVSLVGGGTDLPAFYQRHGGAVVSFAIDLYATAEISNRQKDLELASSDSGARELVSAATFSRRMTGVILAEEFLLYQKAVAAHFGIDRARIAAGSSVPVGAGLASSGSICVALVAAASHYVGDPLSRGDLAETSFRIESEILRRQCGKQDQYASAYGGLNLIEFAQDGDVNVTPLRMEREEMDRLQRRLMLFHNGSRRSAVGPLQEQARRSAGDPDTIGALRRLKQMAYDVRDVLEAGDLDRAGEIMHESWEAKQHLNSQVSTPEISRVYALARRAGAIGGKLAGAGVAGTPVLYCPDEQQDDVRRMMASQGWRERPVSMDFAGVDVTTDVEAGDDLVRT